jgi:hypothetical protein
MNKFHGMFILALLSVLGMLYITITKPNEIEHFAPIATGAVSGYLTLLTPKSAGEKDEDRRLQAEATRSAMYNPNLPGDKGINPGA